MKKCVLTALALLLTVGCASRVDGSAVSATPASTAGTSASGQPPASSTGRMPLEMVKWVDRFCGVAKYLIASGSVGTTEAPAGTPAEMKASISGSLGRLAGVLEVAVHDYEQLLPAPNAGTQQAVEVVLKPLKEAKDKIVGAKKRLDEAPELTSELMTDVLGTMSGAMSTMVQAIEKVNLTSLPADYREAAAQAENCE
ncbi:hypothetical protein [Actinosynnema sp.]|uniref:hypothetical protein n=1 Tax=Actinosynnema sp. TaxID=1872144 RepID=UPI003F85986E